jgi:hypothetical protein
MLWLSLVALPGSACTVAPQFACTDDAQCTTNAAAGRCEAEGVCSFPDAMCPSGHRYGALAGELSGECVGAGSSSGATTEASTSSGAAEGSVGLDESSSSTSTTFPSTLSETSTPETTSIPEPETTTTDAVTSDSGPPTTTGSSDADPYGPCMGDADCPVEGSLCLSIGEGFHVCTPPCVEGECSYEGMTNATLFCTRVTPEMLGCVLTCQDPDVCPAGMVCVPVDATNPESPGVCGWE